MRYAIVIENAGPNFSAYVPDPPGCVATGATVEEAEREIREAIDSLGGRPNLANCTRAHAASLSLTSVGASQLTWFRWAFKVVRRTRSNQHGGLKPADAVGHLKASQSSQE
jgi:hypothetical protein